VWKDSETTQDFLDFEFLKDSLISIIIDDNLSPSCIGIYGDWGSGKSSLMQMCMEELNKNKKNLCISFNGWIFEGYEDTKTALIGSILDQINENKKLEEKAKETIKDLYNRLDKLKLVSSGIKYGADFLLTGGLGTLAGLTLSTILNKGGEGVKDLNIDEIKDLLTSEFSNDEVRQNIKNFRMSFGELLNQTNYSRLVVFIDELDRCTPDTIVETLEAIRLFLFVQNTSFIIGADERHIEYAIKKQYPEIEGHQINIGKEYLEKIVQYPIRIPPLGEKEIKFYILCLFLQKELSIEEFLKIIDLIKKGKQDNFFEYELTYKTITEIAGENGEKINDSFLKDSFALANQLSPVLSDKLNGNPRHCKRFLNSLIMRERMANTRGIPVQRAILAKLMLLEYFKRTHFHELYSIMFNEVGGQSIFKDMENGKYSSKFENWEKDPWVKKWVEGKPNISDIDLRPYFYFSRESLAKYYQIELLRLSPEGRKVINGLSSGSQSLFNKSIDESKNLDAEECLIILNKLIENIKEEEKIDNNLQIILDFGKTRPILISSTLDFLKEINGQRIPFGLIPRIKSFGTDTKKEDEIMEILNIWGEENPKIKSIIKRTFK
jgi:predicted KAP-like P-loop ATPase